MSKALVFGASGQMARALVPLLAERGWQVDAVTRAGRDVPDALAPFARAVPMAASRAATIQAGGGYDAVFDPMAMDASEAADLLQAASDVGQFCVISTASVYADAQGRSFESSGETGFPRFPRLITEAQMTVAAGDGYSSGKVAMELAMLQSKTTILRAGAIYGIGARHPREWWFVKRALDGRARVPLVDQGRNVFHTSSAAGIASLAAFCFQGGHCGLFNVADPQPLTVAQIGHAVFEAMGHQADLISADDLPEAEWQVGYTPFSCENPVRLSTARARGLGWDGGPSYESLMPDYTAWLSSRSATWEIDFPAFAAYGYDAFDYAAEDAAFLP